MKKFGLLMFALMMMGSVVLAQGARRGGEQMDPKVRAERMTERMVKDLSLNDTQKKQLLELNQNWIAKMTGNMQQGRNKQDNDSTAAKKQKREEAPKMTKEEREKMMQEMKVAREDYEAQLQKILTKEQYEAYTKQQAERRQQQGQRGGRR